MLIHFVIPSMAWLKEFLISHMAPCHANVAIVLSVALVAILVEIDGLVELLLMQYFVVIFHAVFFFVSGSRDAFRLYRFWAWNGIVTYITGLVVLWLQWRWELRFGKQIHLWCGPDRSYLHRRGLPGPNGACLQVKSIAVEPCLQLIDLIAKPMLCLCFAGGEQRFWRICCCQCLKVRLGESSWSDSMLDEHANHWSCTLDDE